MRRSSAEGCGFELAELADQARRVSHLTDEELTAAHLASSLEYPFRVANAALTVGFMRALGVESIELNRQWPAEATLASSADVVAHRAGADTARGRDLAVRQPGVELEPQDVSDLPHR